MTPKSWTRHTGHTSILPAHHGNGATRKGCYYTLIYKIREGGNWLIIKHKSSHKTSLSHESVLDKKHAISLHLKAKCYLILYKGKEFILVSLKIVCVFLHPLNFPHPYLALGLI